MNWLLVIRVLQGISVACGFWSVWNGAQLRDRMLLDSAAMGSVLSWEWIASAGPLVLAAALWLASHFLGVRIGLRSELFQSLIAWLRAPQDRATERRLVLAVLDFLTERATGNAAMQKLLGDLAELLRQQWYPEVRL